MAFETHLDPDAFEQLEHHLDVIDERNVSEHHRLVGQQSHQHLRQNLHHLSVAQAVIVLQVLKNAVVEVALNSVVHAELLQTIHGTNMNAALMETV